MSVMLRKGSKLTVCGRRECFAEAFIKPTHRSKNLKASRLIITMARAVGGWEVPKSMPIVRKSLDSRPSITVL